MLVNTIRKLCEQNGITVAQLERTLGFGNGTIARWDDTDPGARRASAVAKYFSTTIDKLLDAND